MVQPNELRIGSRVNSIYTGQYFSITPEDISDITLGHKARHGIPITPELLAKCGFVLDNFWWGDDIFYWHTPISTSDNELSIEIKFDEGKIESVFIGQTDLTHIRSFHQLQNLYFALTNTELEINF